MDIIVLHKNHHPLVVKPEYIEKMKEHAENVYWFETEEELLASGADAEALYLWGGTGPQPEAFCKQSKRLKWINTFSAGVDPLAKSVIKDLPIIVTNAKGVHGPGMGMTTAGFIISHMRCFAELYENQKDHLWRRPVQRDPTIVNGEVVGIIGAGAIAAHVAKYLKPFGFKIIGVKRTVVPLENYDEVYSDKELDDVLPLMDFVVVITPLTKDSVNQFDTERFKKIKNGAFFINISRGGVVDTDALIEALRSGHLSGAALDAVEPEPLPPDSPLWDMPNVQITPHCSASSPYNHDRAVEQFCENFENLKAGRPLFNVVDLKDM